MSSEARRSTEDANDLAGRLNALSPAKRALLEAALAKKRAGAETDWTIARRSGEGPAPLSLAQERMWFAQQIAPDNASYNRPCCLRITGSLQVEVLERVLNEIIRRHEAWRTTFVMGDGQPMQVVAPAEDRSLPVIDMSQFPAEEREQRCMALITADARQPFDLTTGPIVRLSLVRLNPTEHILSLLTHHIVFDGWSSGVLSKEIAALYDAFCQGKASPLPELPVQLADYACWERDWLLSEQIDSLIAYWTQQLGSDPPVLELPTDFPRPPERSFNGAKFIYPLPSQLTERLKALSRQEGVTLYMTLLAAFSVLMARYARQEIVHIGTPTAGRRQVEVEGLLGNFINALVMRVDVSGNPTFRELLRRVREMAVAAYAHQELPFDKLVEAVHPQRTVNRAPLVPVLFQLRSINYVPAEVQGVRFEEIEVDNGTSKVDLGVDVFDLPDGLECLFDYCTDLFASETIARMAGHYRVLLESAAASPDLPVMRLPILTPEETRQIVVEWNATERPLPELCAHRLIERQAKKTPAAVAATFRDEALTYGELNRRANQLAHYLRKRGVGPDVPVGICLERSLWMAVGLLGTLKAGGAYLPLDPAYPRERLAFMLDDAQAPVVVTTERLRDSLPDFAGTAVCLDAERAAIEREPVDNPEGGTAPDHLAYVIYTSGSTGTPKGVLVTHRGMVNHNLAAVELYGLQPGDRMLQFSSLNFDMAVEEIFPTWIAGATLVFRGENALQSGREFTEWLAREKVTVLDLPTAFWHEWVHELAAGTALPPDVRLVIVGGEKAQAPVYAEWQRLAGKSVRWLNTYGPTETTVIATLYDPAANPAGLREGEELPIGRPIANTQAFILDAEGQPVPVGVPGELYLGGTGLARGYLHRPELTAERFIAHPFSEAPDGRLYRTGDVARWRADGNIEFFGRSDDQLKVRGFRVEPGEIETLLNGHPAVRQSVVIGRTAADGIALIAYVVPREDGVTAEALRAALKAQLPDYMVPAAFVMLDRLPLTPSGKVDRRALPAPEAAPGAQHVPPRDELEAQLAQIWQAVLGVEAVGVTDDFFELGGHSLLAVRLFSTIERMLGKRLPLASLFQAPTIAHLADLLREEHWAPRWSSLVPIRMTGTRPPFFFVSYAGGSAIKYRQLSELIGSDQPFYGFQEVGLESQEQPHRSIEAMAAHYIREMRSLQPHGPYYLGGHCFGGLVAFEMGLQLRAQGEQVAMVALVEAYGPKRPYRHSFQFRFQRLKARTSDLSPWERGQQAARGLKHWISDQLHGAAYRVLSRLNLASPRTLRRLDKIAFYRDIIRGYDGAVHPGDVLLFRSEGHAYFDRDPLLWWRGYVEGEIEVYEIAGLHSTFLEEPHVQVLGEKLAGCLQRAQEAHTK
ncbi:MAG: non-ribosomal peptide synthetase [Armatimonadota bacterium]